MPQLELPNTEEEEEEEPRCTTCECTDCECCPCCEQAPGDCDCNTCQYCDEMFRDGDGYCCPDYCSQRCAERSEHYHCECGDVRGEDSQTCENCGRGECCRSFSCRNDDCNRCEDCCRCSAGPIRDYACKDYPPANPQYPPYEPFLYLGVENEVECPRKEPGTVAQAVADSDRGSDLLLKHDGSLDNGFEMVTGKLSLECQQELWSEIAPLAVRVGARSWKQSSTGLHVHLSRNWFTPLTLGKFLVFLNSDLTRPFIVKLAGRESPSYAALAKKKLTDSRLGRSSCNRFEAVNLTNRHTVEVRIFKGTLNRCHILADIEFCHAAAHWAKEVSTADCESWASFWAYVLQNQKPYARLIAYMSNQPNTTGEN